MSGAAVDRLAALVETHVARRARLEREAHEAAWMLATTGAPEEEARSAEAEKAIVRLLSDRAVYAELVALREEPVDDPTARRELEILLLDTGPRQGDPALLARLVDLEVRAEGLYANFRPELDGKPVGENVIRSVLRDSADEDERRRAWEASKRIGPEVAPLLREMVKLRNRIASELGHRDFYAMDLAHQEIDEGFLFGTLDRLEEESRQAWDATRTELFGRLARRWNASPDAIRPWHLADPFFQEAVPEEDVPVAGLYAGRDLVAITRDAFARVGFSIDDVIARSDLHPRDGKNQHAFCTHVDRAGDDVRVLCNVASDDYWMDTMLHEFGHAVYDRGLGPDLPWLLRQPAHTLSTEAIALLFGRLATDPDWMIARLGVAPETVDPLREGLRRTVRTKQLVFPRWVMVMAHFERALYADPDADLEDRWWTLVERYQGVARPPGRTGTADWACKLHLALAPAYYHNYLLGDLMASQLEAWLAQRTAPARWFDSPATGPLLADGLFREGARRTWNEALRRLTGEPLDPRHYVAQFVAPA